MRALNKLFDKLSNHSIAFQQVLASEFTLYFVHAGRQGNFDFNQARHKFNHKRPHTMKVTVFVNFDI